jgi:penicillin-binding protein 1C
MQLAELIDNPDYARRLAPRTPREKLHQMLRALALEASWSKHDILEAYINLISYRGELQGIAAASFGLFDKAPSALTRPEAAVIAALIRSPNSPMVRVRARACRLLALLGAAEECGLLSESHLAYLDQGYHIRPFMQMAPQVAARLKKMPELAHDGLIKSTLDRQLQWVALHSLQRQSGDGAVVVIENATGNVLAYVGNVTAERQAGSTLKPFIYAKAIDERILTAATVLDGSRIDRPVGFDRGFRDLITVRTALASSLNIPAVRALELLGVDTFVATMGDLGFTHLQRPDFYGPSLALGSADMRLLELTNAYRALANGGMWSQVRFSPQQLTDLAPKRALSAQAAFIVSDMLSDREARATLSTRYWTAVQTGTSKDMRDDWCVGFSEKYTVGVWAGNFSDASAPVWQEVMNYLHRNESSHAPEAPAGVLRREVKHNHATHGEWFISGTEPSAHEVDAQPGVRSHISYPSDQSLIAVDPDTPQSRHRLFIQIIAPRPDQNLYLNGRRLGRAQLFLPWEPAAGKYKLELRDSSGQTVDKVRFEVRGRRFASI